MFQQSNLTQSYKDEYEYIQQKEDFVASTFDSDSWVNNNEELKEDMDDNTSLIWPQIWLMAVNIWDLIKWSSNKTQGKLTPIRWDLSSVWTVHLLS